jgi:hypothetical protein
MDPSESEIELEVFDNDSLVPVDSIDQSEQAPEPRTDKDNDNSWRNKKWFKQNRRIIIVISSVVLLILVFMFAFTFAIVVVSYLPNHNSYGVIVDMGSSGTRIQVFQWDQTTPIQPAPTFGKHWYHEEVPGMSSIANNEQLVTEKLNTLFSYAEYKLNSVNVWYFNTFWEF